MFGKLPTNLGHVWCDLSEVMYYLYLPVSMPGMYGWKLPHNLASLEDLLKMVRNDIPERFYNEHVYVTAKRMFVGPTQSPNRPGWHGDGFGSNDLNYVWYDSLPTEFSATHFQNISDDHLDSMLQFEEQAQEKDIVIYPTHTLLKLDQFVIHRVGKPQSVFMRTFVKVSVSPDRYNLRDNSHNYLLNYDWEMHDREKVRNNPASAQKDSYKGE